MLLSILAVPSELVYLEDNLEQQMGGKPYQSVIVAVACQASGPAAEQRGRQAGRRAGKRGRQRSTES